MQAPFLLFTENVQTIDSVFMQKSQEVQPNLLIRLYLCNIKSLINGYLIQI